MGTYVYIDGLNFYYGAVKGTDQKWVDIAAFSRHLVPADRIDKVRYFTAMVKRRWPEDRAHERQNAYLRALRCDPLIEVTMGHFRVDERWRPLADTDRSMADLLRPELQPKWLVDLIFRRSKARRTLPATQARVQIAEEKGSDVNLASYLLHDVFTGACTKAIVVTNDADLETPIRLAAATGVPVGIVNPQRGPINARLRPPTSTFEIPFRREDLVGLQLPRIVRTSRGREIHKPRSW